MKIAICDDDMQMSGKLETLVDECYRGDIAGYSCDVFISGLELLDNIEENGNYQIYILDIEMEGMTGFQVAREIRDHDLNAVILFVTSHKEMMQEAFEVQAFQFIVKPFSEDQAKKEILRAIEYTQIKNKFFYFKVGKKTIVQDYDHIYYFENNRRKIRIHTINKIYEYYGTLDDALMELDILLFTKIHASFIVNLEYLKTVEDEMAVMKTGEKIPVSKKHMSSLNTAYRNFLLMRLR